MSVADVFVELDVNAVNLQVGFMVVSGVLIIAMLVENDLPVLGADMFIRVRFLIAVESTVSNEVLQRPVVCLARKNLKEP